MCWWCRERGRLEHRQHGFLRGLQHARRSTCPIPFNRDEEPYERSITDWIASWRLDHSHRSRIASFVRANGGDTTARRANIEKVLQRARRLYLLGDISDGEYDQERSVAQRALHNLPPDDAQAATGSFGNLARSWLTASLPARRAVIEELFDRVLLGDDGTVEIVVREKYRTLVAAVADPVLTLKYSAPNRVGRGHRPTKERQPWARRDLNPHALSSNGS